MSTLLQHLQDLKAFRDKRDQPEYNVLIWNMVNAHLDELIALAKPSETLDALFSVFDEQPDRILTVHMSLHQHDFWAAVVDHFRHRGIVQVPATKPRTEELPLSMLLYCPACGTQHIDEPDELTPGWTNPPHRSHLCHACACIWRPADVPTNGVKRIGTLGKADTWEPGSMVKAVRSPQGK